MSDRPNIVVFWGDDIGISNLSCYSDGLMGYRTPNIDRLADEGMRFTDSYGEQSCTAGRSAFITGQSVYRTGLSKVGMPGAATGMPAEDPLRIRQGSCLANIEVDAGETGVSRKLNSGLERIIANADGTCTQILVHGSVLVLRRQIVG